MRKVAVFGNSGGDKPTLARQLAEVTQLRLCSLDRPPSLIVLCGLVILASCANRPAPIPLPGVGLYSRNAVACLPTGVGNVACGGPGLIVLLAIAGATQAAAGEAVWQDENLGKAGAAVSAVVSWIPAYVCGAATGTLFIPLSFLVEEHPCNFM
jgi:hypothetical protein